MRISRKLVFPFLVALLALPATRPVRAQAALLMEEPYGFFGALNPTGHTAIYFERICAATPTRLRRCGPGEMGAVLSRYQGIGGYDWIAIPLLPYLYSVDRAGDVPGYADRALVGRLRDHYHEAHLADLGGVKAGSFLHGGWTELVGVSYERRIFAFRFETTPEQDNALMDSLNMRPNQSHFDLIYNNCADFARGVLNNYFPKKFRRSIFPDAGMTTPKQLAYKLERYAHKHPSVQLAVFEVPQIPGSRRRSVTNKSVSEALVTTSYAVPLALVNPYLTGGILVDYLIRGRFHPVPTKPMLLTPENLASLTLPAEAAENPDSAGRQATGVAAVPLAPAAETAAADTGLKEAVASHE